MILPALCLCALLSAPVTAQMIIRVDGDNGAATPPNADGEDWGASAYKYLRDAIARAESVLSGEDPPPAVHIWVKGNTQSPYLPHQSELGHLTGSAALEASFVLSDGISIFGGFAGTEEEAEFNARDHTANVTILCGDLNQDDDDPQTGFLEDGLLPVDDAAFDVNSSSYDDFWTRLDVVDNAYSVVRSPEGTIARQIDGFVVRRGGNADAEEHGGGVRVEGSPLIITRCHFGQNRLLSEGGAISVHATGGLSGGGQPADVDIRNCEFFDNLALGAGGAIYHGSGSQTNASVVRIVNALFHGNRAGQLAGAIAVHTTVLGDCELCEVDDVLECAAGGTPVMLLANSTIMGNRAMGGESIFGYVGGVHSRGSIDVVNTILWGNRDADGTSGLAAMQFDVPGMEPRSWVRLRSSCIESDAQDIPAYGLCDTGNIDDDPEFVDPDATDPRDRDYRLQSTSPCRDTGDTVEILLERWGDVYDLDQNGFVEAPTPDLDMTARRKSCHVDMGAYEYDPGSASAGTSRR